MLLIQVIPYLFIVECSNCHCFFSSFVHLPSFNLLFPCLFPTFVFLLLFSAILFFYPRFLLPSNNVPPCFLPSCCLLSLFWAAAISFSVHSHHPQAELLGLFFSLLIFKPEFSYWHVSLVSTVELYIMASWKLETKIECLPTTLRQIPRFLFIYSWTFAINYFL